MTKEQRVSEYCRTALGSQQPWSRVPPTCASVHSAVVSLLRAQHGNLELHCYVHYIYMRGQYFKLGGKHMDKGVTLPNTKK